VGQQQQLFQQNNNMTHIIIFGPKVSPLRLNFLPTKDSHFLFNFFKKYIKKKKKKLDKLTTDF